MENENKEFEETENKEIKGIKNWDAETRFYLLKELKVFELPNFTTLGQNKKYGVIANILNCHFRTAKKYFNNYKNTLPHSKDKLEMVKEYLKSKVK